MIIFPISRQKKLRKLPWITIALIIINTLIFLETWPAIRKANEEFYELDQKAYALEEAIEAIDTQLEYLYDSRKSYESNEAYYFTYIKRLDVEIRDHEEQLVTLQSQQKTLEDLADTISKSLPYQKFGYINLKGGFWRLITYQFLHGGYFHLFFNMFFLWFVGCNIEDRWGKWFFLGFYLASGIAAALVHSFIFPSSIMPLVGASGSIAGAMGVYMIKYPMTKVKVFYLILFRFGVAEWRAWTFFIFWFIMQFFYAYLTDITGDMSVAYWAHIGGFFFGAAIALIMQITDFEEKVISPKIQIQDKKLLNIDPRVLDARDLIDEGDSIKAEEILRSIVANDPLCYDAFVMLVDILSHKSTIPNEELREFELQVIRLAAKNNQDYIAVQKYYKYSAYLNQEKILSPNTLIFLARALEMRDSSQDAVLILKKLIKEYPESTLADKALYELGKIMSRHDQKEQAIKIFKALLKREQAGFYKAQINAELIKAFEISVTQIEE